MGWDYEAGFDAGEMSTCISYLFQERLRSEHSTLESADHYIMEPAV